MNKFRTLYSTLKEGLISFKGSHEIHTPQKLVEEILSNIQLGDNILVMFNLEFVISLLYLHNINPDRITFYSDHENKSLMCAHMGVKYVTELDTAMKFDVVLLNPPFDYIRHFRELSEKMANDKVVLVSDVASMDYDGSFDNIAFYKNLGGSVFDVQMTTCYSIIDPVNKVSSTIVANKKNESIVVSKVPFLPGDDLTSWSNAVNVTNLKLPGYDIVWARLYKNKIKKTTSGIKIIIFNGKKDGPFDYIIGDSDHSNDVANLGVHKVILAKNSTIGKLGPAKYAGPEYGCSHGIVSIAFATEQEARDAADYLNSDLVAKLVKGIKTKAILNNQSVLSRIPKLQYKSQWETLV